MLTKQELIQVHRGGLDHGQQNVSKGNAGNGAGKTQQRPPLI